VEPFLRLFDAKTTTVEQISLFKLICSKNDRLIYLTPWRLGGFGDFRKKTAVFGCLTNALARPPIALESCSTAQTDRPV